MLLENPAPGPTSGLIDRGELTFVAPALPPVRRPVPLGWLKHAFNPNDAAQARLFSELMQAEIDDLEALIAVAQDRWAGRLDAGWGAARTPEPVLRLREKLKEVQRLQDALRARFGPD